MKRQITFAGACYDRTQALIDGTVKPDGLRIQLAHSSLSGNMETDAERL